MIRAVNGRFDCENVDVETAPDRAGTPTSDGAAARRSVERFIGEHPVASVAAALILGAALGWFIKRR